MERQTQIKSLKDLKLPTLEEVEEKVREADRDLRKKFDQDRRPHHVSREVYYSMMSSSEKAA